MWVLEVHIKKRDLWSFLSGVTVLCPIDKLSSDTFYAVYSELMKGSLNKSLGNLKHVISLVVSLTFVYVIVLFCQNSSFLFTGFNNL